MAKTLVIAEKPSVGRDLSRVLPGPFAKHEGYLEGPEHILTWAVGHLVQLAEPDEYDPRYKKWRMADLPIVPDRFKLVVRDERSKKRGNDDGDLARRRSRYQQRKADAATYEPNQERTALRMACRRSHDALPVNCLRAAARARRSRLFAASPEMVRRRLISRIVSSSRSRSRTMS